MGGGEGRRESSRESNILLTIVLLCSIIIIIGVTDKILEQFNIKVECNGICNLKNSKFQTSRVPRGTL